MLGAAAVYLLWYLYSFCYCPYPFYIRFFIRIYELLFGIQIFLLTLSVFRP